MESKLPLSVPQGQLSAAPFNRTSMESKLCDAAPGFCAVPLLIEPVWNRNLDWACWCAWRYVLLIEPVWNRNSSMLSFIASIIPLLIEPVWNRNMQHAGKSWLIQDTLLIEPVWNRSNTPMFMVDSNNI